MAVCSETFESQSARKHESKNRIGALRHREWGGLEILHADQCFQSYCIQSQGHLSEELQRGSMGYDGVIARLGCYQTSK